MRTTFVVLLAITGLCAVTLAAPPDRMPDPAQRWLPDASSWNVSPPNLRVGPMLPHLGLPRGGPPTRFGPRPNPTLNGNRAAPHFGLPGFRGSDAMRPGDLQSRAMPPGPAGPAPEAGVQGLQPIDPYRPRQVQGRVPGGPAAPSSLQRSPAARNTLPPPEAAASANALVQEWAVTYNGPYSQGVEYGWAVAVDASGNTYVAGYCDPGEGTSEDFLTVKYDASGGQQWVAWYDGPVHGQDQAYDIAVDASGDVYVAGVSMGSGAQGWNWDYATVKYDADGNQQWVARYDGPCNLDDYVSALVVDASGGVYVTGYGYGSGYDYDCATVKYNADGNQEWVARYEGPDGCYDVALDIALDPTGNVCVAGSSYSDFLTLKYNAANGNQLWIAEYDGPAQSGGQAQAIAVDVLGNIYVTGCSDGDYATVKYNENGVEQWVARYDGPVHQDDVGQAIALDAPGNVYVTGWSWGAEWDTDYATVKYNESGVEQWVVRYDGPAHQNDEPCGIAVDASGSVYVSGTSYLSRDYYQGSDYVTVKYNSSGGEEWVALYDGPAGKTDRAFDLAMDDAGVVYVTGWSVGLGTGYDCATIAYDADGSLKRVFRYATEGKSNDGAMKVACDAAGNVFFTGSCDGLLSGSDYATFKYDASGSQQWIARYDGPGLAGDQANDLVLDASGNVYVTGYSDGSELYNTDYATIKYNENGVEQWVARYDGPTRGDDYTCAIAMDGSGNVYVTGCSYASSFQNSDFATVKYGPDGIEQWVAVYDGPANFYDGASAMALDASGNVYVTGWSYDVGYNTDYATVKYDAATGEQLWEARYDGPTEGYDSPSSIALDASGGVYVTGYSYDPAYTNADYVTIKYEAASGNQVWEARYDGPAHSLDDPRGMAIDGSGNVYVTGESFTPDYAGCEAATVKYNSSGAELWVARYDDPPSGYYYPRAIVLDVSGNAYLTGQTGDDCWTIAYDPDGSELATSRYNGTASSWDVGWSIAVDAVGNVYVVGVAGVAGHGSDALAIKYKALRRDVGIASIVKPSGTVPPGAVTPQAVVHNYGTLKVGFDVTFKINSAPPYEKTVNVPGGVPPGEDLTVDFPAWDATEGYYTAECRTVLSGDNDPDNDVKTVDFAVAASGWTVRESLPKPPSGGFEGLGGWLAYDAGSGLIYAAKGEKTGDFHAFNPVTNTWEERASIPPYMEKKKPKLPDAGCRGVSDGSGRIYMTLGNKTPKFLSYTSSEGWTWLTNVPDDVFRGTDAVFVNGAVYLLNGKNTRFYRYTVATSTWSDLGALPPGLAGWTEGSWLVYDGDHTLYAQQAQTEQLWAYDLSAPTPAVWIPLPGMPMNGTSYAGTGSAGVLLDGVIYALKGNNTAEFWKCVPGATPMWTQLGNILTSVKDGGDICASQNMLFAFSGNRTNQFWRYVRTPEGAFGGGAGAGTALLPTEFELSVSPNPMKLGAAISYSVPTATKVSLKLYDITGALTKTVSNGQVKPGRYTASLSTQGLARGVYILKLESGASNVTRKLVIE